MKPQEITIAGKDYFAWQYEEQTQIKHKLLAYYWRIWVSKLGKYRDTARTEKLFNAIPDIKQLEWRLV